MEAQCLSCSTYPFASVQRHVLSYGTVAKAAYKSNSVFQTSRQEHPLLHRDFIEIVRKAFEDWQDSHTEEARHSPEHVPASVFAAIWWRLERQPGYQWDPI